VVKKVSIVATMLLSATLSGCYTTETNGSSTNLPEPQNAVEEARSNNDYRLYAFKGRRMTVPGLTPEQQQKAQEMCGTKLMEGTGDVIKTPEDREQRKTKLKFATEYNRLMFTSCITNQ